VNQSDWFARSLDPNATGARRIAEVVCDGLPQWFEAPAGTKLSRLGATKNGASQFLVSFPAAANVSSRCPVPTFRRIPFRRKRSVEEVWLEHMDDEGFKFCIGGIASCLGKTEGVFAELASVVFVEAISKQARRFRRAC